MCAVYDDNNDIIIVYEMMSSHTNEIIKRVNLHGELVDALDNCARELMYTIRQYNANVEPCHRLDEETIDICFKLVGKCRE